VIENVSMCEGLRGTCNEVNKAHTGSQEQVKQSTDVSMLQLLYETRRMAGKRLRHGSLIIKINAGNDYLSQVEIMGK
jgi:hypothetical protein